jgi:uncharacterized membrane protein
MNIEDLTKTQMLWLTILVNFVTSIAVGVLTVSLLDQAPQTVTRTINQIVEHTVETVATQTQLPTIVATNPKPTNTPTQEQQMTAAIAAASARTVTIYRYSTSTPAIATGVYLPKTRAVVTLATASLPKEAVIEFANGDASPASISRAGSGITIYGFADTDKLPDAPIPARIAQNTLKAGQTVIALLSDRSAAVGIISKLDAAGIVTNLPLVPAGAAAVNLSGDIIGLSAGTAGDFISADKITALLNVPAPSP